MEQHASRSLRSLAHVSLFLSGAAALSYEICWVRQAAVAFGSTTLALSTVLAAFFGGLALGSEFFGRRSRHLSRPLRGYALLEIGVGVSAGLTLLGFPAAEVVFGWLFSRFHDSPAALAASRALLVSLLLLPPTFCMGGTLPLFVRQMVATTATMGTSVARLYALNTLGACLGALITGLWLIPLLGLRATILLAGVVNVALGLALLRLPTPAVAKADTDRREAPPRAKPALVLTAIVFLAGFVTLGQEVVWSRFLALLVRNTVHSYTLMLTTVLLGIVIGSLLIASRLDRLQRPARLLGWLLGALGVLVTGLLLLPAPWWRDLVTKRSGDAARLVLYGVTLLPAAVLSGMAFPLTVRVALTQAADAGAWLGRITAVNTFGGIVGSFTVGFAVLPGLGLQAALLLTTGLTVAAALLAWLVLEGGTTRRPWLLAGTLTAAWLAVPMLSTTRLPHDYLGTAAERVEVRDGTAAPVAVLQRGRRKSLEIDRLWQGENRKNHQILAAHIPMLTHPDPRRVVAIGVGAGQTPRRFLDHDIDHLTCIDIEAEVFGMLRRHFDGGWLDDPRVRVLVADGRSALAHLAEQWDLISVEVGQTFRPGAATFYTADFYQQAARRLADGGYLCQFVPLGFLRPDEFRSILATFLDVLPHAMLWYNTEELLLIGSRQPLRLQAARLAQLAENPVIHADLRWAYFGGRDWWLHDRQVFLGGFLASTDALRRMSGSEPIQRDDRPALEYSVARHAGHLDLTAVETVATLIHSNLSDVSDILDEPLSETQGAVVENVREANLSDLTARVLRRQAADLQTLGRHAASIPLLEDARRRNPESLSARKLLAHALTRTGRAAESLDLYREVVERDPDDVEARFNLALRHMEGGNWNAARPLLQTAHELDPDHAEVAFNLGVTLHQLAEYAAAAAVLRQALDGMAEDVDARLALGAALSRSGDADGALQQYDAILAGHPDHAQAHYRRGTVLAAQGDLRGAVTAYRAAVRGDPQLVAAHLNLGNALSGVGQSDAALESFATAADLAPDLHAAHLNRGVLLAVLGRPAEAEPSLREAVRTAPGSPAAHLELGRVLYANHRRDEAREHFLTASRLAPQSPDVAAHIEAARRGEPLPPRR